jgi:hypothetical protein
MFYFYTCPITKIEYAVTIITDDGGQLVKCNGRAKESPAWFTNRWIDRSKIKEVDMGNVCCMDSQRYI